MFEQLGGRLKGTFKKLRGQGRLSQDNIRDALREVRIALLEADVALPVVKAFIEQVRSRAIGQEVLDSLAPGQLVIKIVQDELAAVMGTEAVSLELSVKPPAVILLAGLQGAGKTTTAAKLARRLQQQDKRKVLMASVDVHRPAAMEQLARLGREIEVEVFASDETVSAPEIARQALAYAHRKLHDVLIVDTAGRLHVDQDMMAEIQAIHGVLDPAETLFVLDATTGQDAVNSATVFHQKLLLTGVVLTKVDGDARGGAALSVRKVTGCPIKFIGVGEKIDALETFHPDRIASRILGMGDVVGLVESVQKSVDEDQARKLASKLKKGKKFDLEDFRDQMQQVGKMGGITSLLERMPGMDGLPGAARDQINDQQINRVIAIIDSMTPRERRKPDIIRGSRKRRIATGSGTQVQDVNRLLKQHSQMQKMMKRLGKGNRKGMQQMLAGMGRQPRFPM